MTDVDKVNALTRLLVRSVGQTVGASGEFKTEMVVIEGLVAGLIVSAALRYNRQPEDIIEALSTGIKERVDRAIYGETKQ